MLYSTRNAYFTFFFLHTKVNLFILNQRLSWEEIKQNLLGEYMFYKTWKDSSLGPQLLFLP